MFENGRTLLTALHILSLVGRLAALAFDPSVEHGRGGIRSQGAPMLPRVRRIPALVLEYALVAFVLFAALDAAAAVSG